MHFSRLVGVGFLVLLPGSHSLNAQAGGATSRMSGCYRLTLSSWSSGLPPTGMPQAHTPPTHFRLDTLVSARNAAWFTVKPAALVEMSRMEATWKPMLGDSLTIVWSTGFVGVSLRLAIRRDSLIGRATTFHDYHVRGEPPDPSADVVAVREQCPNADARPRRKTPIR